MWIKSGCEVQIHPFHCLRFFLIKNPRLQDAVHSKSPYLRSAFLALCSKQLLTFLICSACHLFFFFISADMFSPVEKSSKAEGNEWDQVWGRFLTASSLMWSLTLPEHKKKPRPPPSQSLLFFFLPLSFSAWSVRYLTILLLCFGVGRRNASRWKEKRVLVGAVALDFKPYKISNAPQSQTSNWQQVIERETSKMILSRADLVLGATGQPCLCLWVHAGTFALT